MLRLSSVASHALLSPVYLCVVFTLRGKEGLVARVDYS